MQSVIEFANKGGKVLGICNGFQILCESGLLPGVLLRNSNMQFVCKNIFLIDKKKNTPKNVLKIPVAHGEGRYFADENVLNELHKHEQILYRYCNNEGFFDNADYSPNGSINNIAGICNKQRNVFAMMPHPERACSTLLGNTDGRQIFSDLFSIN
jgi:phosphoribosylformylglycinamidine synthase subunit PurQ / glutaminase